MKSGKTLVQLATEVQRQANTKRDYIANTQTLQFNAQSKLNMEVEEQELTLAITNHAHNQIANKVGIPIAYYKRMMLEAPLLLQNNVNHWFQANPEKRMVRTLDGQARAFLSNRYRRIDNYELLETILPIIHEMGEGVEIVSTEITATKLYLKVINKRLELEVQKGDAVQAGFVVSNSEIGLGAVSVEPLIYRLVCTNGMIAKDYGTKRYHLGRSNGSEQEIYEIYADDTIKADDEALLLKVRDMVRTAVDVAKFNLLVDGLKTLTEKKIVDPLKTIEVTAKTFGFNQDEKSGILNHLIAGGDLSGYGLLNSISRTAQDIDCYDRATEIEAISSKVLDLPKSTWKELTTV